MSKYLLVYQGKVDPSTQSAPTEESMQQLDELGQQGRFAADRLRLPDRAPHPCRRVR